jgi:hypothetical protein
VNVASWFLSIGGLQIAAVIAQDQPVIGFEKFGSKLRPNPKELPVISGLSVARSGTKSSRSRCSGPACLERALPGGQGADARRLRRRRVIDLLKVQDQDPLEFRDHVRLAEAGVGALDDQLRDRPVEM